MPKPPLVSLCVLLFNALLLIIYDVWLWTRGGPANTISWHVYLVSCEEPIVPVLLGLVLGILIGHIFWPNCGGQ